MSNKLSKAVDVFSRGNVRTLGPNDVEAIRSLVIILAIIFVASGVGIGLFGLSLVLDHEAFTASEINIGIVKVKTGSVGVGMASIGAAIIIITIRQLVDLLKSVALK